MTVLKSILADGCDIIRACYSSYSRSGKSQGHCDRYWEQRLNRAYRSNNKIGKSDKQISIVLHVDDLMVISESQDDLDKFGLYSELLLST